jgi:hypothetical protein
MPMMIALFRFGFYESCGVEKVSLDPFGRSAPAQRGSFVVDSGAEMTLFDTF